MTDKPDKAGINFDKSCWPECGTVVASLPSDLKDLWGSFPEQAGTFIAEAILDESHTSFIWIQDGKPFVVTSLWSIGGDQITYNESLVELLDSFYETHKSRHPEDQKILSDALDEIEMAVKQLKLKLEQEKENG